MLIARDSKSQTSGFSFSDAVSFDLHQLVAARLREDAALLEAAKTCLREWMRKSPGVEAWVEWQAILETLDLESILEIITGINDHAQRLRTSSPFAGLVSQKERNEVIERRAKTQSF